MFGLGQAKIVNQMSTLINLLKTWTLSLNLRLAGVHKSTSKVKICFKFTCFEFQKRTKFYKNPFSRLRTTTVRRDIVKELFDLFN